MCAVVRATNRLSKMTGRPAMVLCCVKQQKRIIKTIIAGKNEGKKMMMKFFKLENSINWNKQG